jgi:excisionase family DNA binding protein
MRALRAVEPLKSEHLRVVMVQQLMTPEQLAAYLQVAVPTIYVWVSNRKKNAQGDVLPFRKVGHLLRFDFSEIVDWTRGKANGD